MLVERYIFRIAFGSFLGCVVALTGTIWVTQALRELDLLTAKGQTLLVFFAATALLIPTLVAVIAPVALFVAVTYTLNKLNSDSELIVMSAAGLPPHRLLRPFLALGAMVAVLVSVVAIVIMPASVQELRVLITKIRADFLANVVKEGQFTTLDNGITFHFRERSGQTLLGIFMQDRREAGRTVVYLAERGQTLDIAGQSYMVLEQGSIHRQQPDSRDSSIVSFERYAVDLSAFNRESAEVIYKAGERSTSQLMFPDESEPYYLSQPGRFRSELHTRLSGWLYPIAMLLIAFAALGQAQTTRQGRGMALAAAVVAVVVLRIVGFYATAASVRSASGVYLVYGAPFAAIVIAAAFALGGQRMQAARAALARLAPTSLPRLRLRRAAA